MKKTIFHFCITIACVIGAAIITLPTDENCIRQTSGALANIPFSSFFEKDIADNLYTVDNHIVFKTVTNRFTGTVVAYAFFK